MIVIQVLHTQMVPTKISILGKRQRNSYKFIIPTEFMTLKIWNANHWKCLDMFYDDMYDLRDRQQVSCSVVVCPSGVHVWVRVQQS